jgi:hypothetical protein
MEALVTTRSEKHTVILSRRTVLHGVAVAAAMSAAGATAPADAQTKVSQKTVQYQSTPKGAARCDNCIQWQAPSSCKFVQGTISPTGWCSIYAPKPKS